MNTADGDPSDPLLDSTEVAARLNIHPTTLRRWADTGHGPQAIRIGARLLRWRASDVETWLTHQQQETGR